MSVSPFVRIGLLALVLFVLSCESDDDPASIAAPNKNPVVLMDTSLGQIELELFPLDAPITVGNFLRYVHESFYDGLTIHRVVPKFMIQGGQFDKNMQRKPAHEPIPNEANNGLLNLRGTIAMARTNVPHSATCQFFINLTDNPLFDFEDETNAGWGYCVFGRIIGGMDVVDAIAAVKTVYRDGFTDVPEDPVIILKLYRKP